MFLKQIFEFLHYDLLMASNQPRCAVKDESHFVLCSVRVR